MKDIKKIINYINGSIAARFSIVPISYLVYENERVTDTKTNLKDIDEKYHNITINELLALHRINLLIDNSIVSCEEGNKLIELYFRYIDLKKKLMEYPDPNKLNVQVNKIKIVLDKWFIFTPIDDYIKLLDESFLGKFDYCNGINKQLNNELSTKNLEESTQKVLKKQ